MPQKISSSQMFGLPVKMQANTTNSTLTDARIEIGWGVIAGSASTVLQEAITFQTAFTSRPIVIITFGGDQIGGSTSYGQGSASRNNAYAEAHSISTTGFLARVISSPVSNWATGDLLYYQWVAIGV